MKLHLSYQIKSSLQEIQFDEIKKECDKYSLHILKYFQHLFPCQNKIIPVYYLEENIIRNYYDSYLWASSIEDFWKNWNKIKKIIFCL